MKTFYTAIYLVLTAILVWILNSYIENSEMYENKMEKIDSNFSQFKHESGRVNDGDNFVLVIGNSYVASSFLDELSDDDIYVFTVFGMSLSDAVNIVELLPDDTPVSKLVIGVGYNESIPIAANFSAYRRYESFNMLQEYWWTIPLVRGRSMITTILKEDVKCQVAQLKGGKCKSELEQETVAIHALEPDQGLRAMEKSVKIRFGEYTPYTFEVSNEFERQIKHLQELASQKNIDLFLYTAPIYSGLKQRLDQDTIAKFHHILRTSVDNYIDLNEKFPDIGYRYYEDATHLDKEYGAPITTKFMKNYVRNGTMDTSLAIESFSASGHRVDSTKQGTDHSFQ